MDKKNLDELVDSLGLIALFKSMLPLHLRGWVNALGLYVREREAGRWVESTWILTDYSYPVVI